MARRADHDLKREVFAAAALRVIMRAGVGGLTVREVAKEAGFTTGALTHYFQSKDQVLIEASEYSARLVRPRMEKKARASDALGALKGVVDERAAYNPAVAKVMRARYDEWRGRLAVLIRRAQGEGLAPSDVDADLASQELVALVDGIAIQVLLGTGRISAARQREIIGAWIGLLAGGHVGRAGRPLGADPASRAVG
jgi:AcrR family transcriptional regulator